MVQGNDWSRVAQGKAEGRDRAGIETIYSISIFSVLVDLKQREIVRFLRNR